VFSPRGSPWRDQKRCAEKKDKSPNAATEKKKAADDSDYRSAKRENSSSDRTDRKGHRRREGEKGGIDLSVVGGRLPYVEISAGKEVNPTQPTVWGEGGGGGGGIVRIVRLRGGRGEIFSPRQKGRRIVRALILRVEGGDRCRRGEKKTSLKHPSGGGAVRLSRSYRHTGKKKADIV